MGVEQVEPGDDRAFDQRLVTAVGDQLAEEAPGCRGDRRRPQLIGHGDREQLGDDGIVERADEAREQPRQRPPQPPGRAAAARGRQPAGERGGDVQPLHPPRHHRGRQEIILEERRQRVADAVLVFGHDRGVRDRQPERAAEQRGDREPVGEAADQRRLGESAQVAEAGHLRIIALRPQRGGEHRRHRHQQQRRQQPHAVERSRGKGERRDGHSGPTHSAGNGAGRAPVSDLLKAPPRRRPSHFSISSAMVKAAGTMIRVRIVDSVIPPITATPIG